MMTKKMKRVLMEPSPSYVVDDEARARFKYQSLLQDYEELQKETDQMNKGLQRAKERRKTLLAEVRFLRRRYKFLMKNRSSNLRPAQDLARPKNSAKPIANGRIYSANEASLRNPSPVLDLNQISRGEDEQEEAQAVLEPLQMEKKPKKCMVSAGSSEQLNDLKLFVCRDIGNGSGQTGKKKISWQDQVVLKV